MRYILGVAAFLLLASSCDAGKAPHTQGLGAAQQASPATNASSGAEAETNYIAAKATYVASLAAEQKRGTPDSVLDVHEAAALRDLGGRLRRILDPFRGEGFTDSGTTNVTTLVPQMDFGALDGIAYHSSDSITVVVTTRTLLESWLRDSVAGDTALPRDPTRALARTELYQNGIPEDAAVSRYADIPVADAAQSGVVAAMLVLRAQDFGIFTPNELVVSVVRGNRVYLIEAPTHALIAPMASCVPIWREASRKVDSLNQATRPTLLALTLAAKTNPTDTAALSDSVRIQTRVTDRIENHADTLFRQCYAEHVTADPRFPALSQQVDSIVQRLPPP